MLFDKVKSRFGNTGAGRGSYSPPSSHSGGETKGFPHVSETQSGLHSSPPDSSNGHHEERYVEWGVKWYKQPLLISLIFLAGTGASVAHHEFYDSLNGRRPRSDVQKQAALVGGNILSFLAIYLWRISCVMSYRQYIWTTVKKKSLKVSTLDSIFSLTSDPRGFFSFEVLTRAKVLVLMAIIVWLIPLGGIGLSSTLIVVNAPTDSNPVKDMSVLDWKEGKWYPSTESRMIPSSEVMSVAIRAATDMDVLPFSGPSANSSYTIQLRGPYAQCEPANTTQRAILSTYKYYYGWEGNKVTISNYNEIEAARVDDDGIEDEESAEENVWSAFDLGLGGPNGWNRGYTNRNGEDDGWDADAYNNWGVRVADNSTGYYVEGLNTTYLTNYWRKEKYGEKDIANWEKLYRQMIPRQLFVLTSNSSLVCTLGNATREVNFNFTNSVQTISYGPLQNFTPIFVSRYGNTPFDTITPSNETYSYLTVWQAMLNMLSGNITTAHDRDKDARIVSSDSRVLLTGLSSCDEFANNAWVDNWYTHYQNIRIHSNGTHSGNDSVPTEPPYNTRVFGELDLARCRNRTLARAIEDLSANITISLLASQSLLSAQKAQVSVHVTTSEQRYRYDSLTVLISYVIVGIASIFCLFLGFIAFVKNGITHNNNFSGILSVSRNSRLDRVFEGYSTGVKDLGDDVEKTRLRLGVVSEGMGRGHVAFDIKGEYAPMVKGGKYY